MTNDPVTNTLLSFFRIRWRRQFSQRLAYQHNVETIAFNFLPGELLCTLLTHPQCTLFTHLHSTLYWHILAVHSMHKSSHRTSINTPSQHSLSTRLPIILYPHPPQHTWRSIVHIVLQLPSECGEPLSEILSNAKSGLEILALSGNRLSGSNNSLLIHSLHVFNQCVVLRHLSRLLNGTTCQYTVTMQPLTTTLSPPPPTWSTPFLTPPLTHQLTHTLTLLLTLPLTHPLTHPLTYQPINIPSNTSTNASPSSSQVAGWCPCAKG